MTTKRELRFFNNTGPCNPDDHYMLPPQDRLVGAQLDRYVRHELYWVLHAPRQTGKTTFLQSWMREINRSGEAVACYVSVERCQAFADPSTSMLLIAEAIRTFAERSDLPIPDMPDAQSGSIIDCILGGWAELVAPKPLIVLFDEVDVLQGESIVSFLRQLRSGFANRGAGRIPVSIALVGMRDLKDYGTDSKGGVPLNPGSPFNIKADSAVLTNFSKEDVARLFAQRTAENGQQITTEALDYVYDQSKGQPWIVNSLFGRATMRVLHWESTETVTLDHIQEARQQMILARETHLDALAVRLREPPIRGIIEPMITGEANPEIAESETFRHCLDLGLVAIERGNPTIANPIYREVIARHLTYGQQLAIPEPTWQWQKNDGTLDMDRLLQEFQKFWRRHADTWETKTDYTEAFPHLLLMAFLQRVLNGGEHIDREYAAGRGRMDLGVEYNGLWYIIEIKLVHSYDTPKMVREEGLEQIKSYRDKLAANAPCYLVIFDRRQKTRDKPWDERISWETEGDINVLCC